VSKIRSRRNPQYVSPPSLDSRFSAATTSAAAASVPAPGPGERTATPGIRSGGAVASIARTRARSDGRSRATTAGARSPCTSKRSTGVPRAMRSAASAATSPVLPDPVAPRTIAWRSSSTWRRSARPGSGATAAAAVASRRSGGPRRSRWRRPLVHSGVGSRQLRSARTCGTGPPAASMRRANSRPPKRTARSTSAGEAATRRVQTRRRPEGSGNQCICRCTPRRGAGRGSSGGGPFRAGPRRSSPTGPAGRPVRYPMRRSGADPITACGRRGTRTSDPGRERAIPSNVPSSSGRAAVICGNRAPSSCSTSTAWPDGARASAPATRSRNERTHRGASERNE